MSLILLWQWVLAVGLGSRGGWGSKKEEEGAGAGSMAGVAVGAACLRIDDSWLASCAAGAAGGGEDP